jgi:ubiquinone/menaquinone biosynthesis C-methylase UbiE
MFNLETRVPSKQFNDIDEVRAYDLNMRKGALVSYQKPGERILKHMSEGAMLAEVGFNTGLLTFLLAGKRNDAMIVGVENNPNFHEVAEESLNLCFWSGLDADIEFERADFTELPFDDNSVDVVFSNSSLHLWEDPVATLKECNRICKDDGIVIIEDLNRHAEEGYISFVLQFVKEGGEKFMAALRASYNQDEIRLMLKSAGLELEGWQVRSEDLGLIVSSKEI